MAPRTSRSERGFTLIELMITVAIIALLAGIAVPAFFGESRKAKAKSEVTWVMAELGIREDQYRLENGSYVSAAPCPAAPSPTPQDATGCIATGQVWNSLRVKLQEDKLYCSYEIVAGSGTGTNNPGGFTFTSPPGAWYYIMATCNMDNNAGLNSTYFVSNISSGLQKQNEGH